VRPVLLVLTVLLALPALMVLLALPVLMVMMVLTVKKAIRVTPGQLQAPPLR
jgi:hypothetical protein